MKLYFIAGEDSGDLHTANLIKELKAMRPEVQLRGVGGDHMEAQGLNLVAHIRDINFMGFWEVITHLGIIRKLFKTVKADLMAWKPAAVVLVDYPGFNLRLLPFIKAMGIPVYYYISPQLWAWKKGRVKKIKKWVDRMFVILPFEKEFYAKEGLEVDFVGHPLMDAVGIGEGSEVKKITSEKPTIALLPGSRKQEIRSMLPVMLQMVQRFSAHFIIAGAPSQTEEFYQDLIGEVPVELVMNQTYEVLKRADAALVTSGTATLETALFGVPEVVCYKGGWLSYQIGKRLVNVKFISLVNLILDRPAVVELIQNDFHADRLAAELQLLLEADKRTALVVDYAALRERLGGKGASRRVAEGILIAD